MQKSKCEQSIIILAENPGADRSANCENAEESVTCLRCNDV